MVEEALRALCSTSKSFVGALSMIFLILGLVLHAANYLLKSGKPKTAKRPLLWLGGTAFLLLFILGIAIYILMPFILPEPCIVEQSDLPPYCGEYCQNSSIPKYAWNCTCLQY